MSDIQRYACYVINLDRTPERLGRISDQLKAVGVAFERFSAVDGRTLDLDRSPDFDRRGYERAHGKTVTAGEVGCFLSHVGVMKQFLTSRAEFCLVLEDDALVGPDLPLVMNELIAHRTRWDVAFLYGNHSGLPVKTERLGEVGALVGFFGRQTGTVAYIVNRKAATVYANRLLPMRLPIDHSFDRAWRLDIRIRGVAPFPVKTGGFSSDIGRTGRKFVWYRRISTLLTRTRAESNRAFHYLFRDRIWLEAARHRITRKG